ncbi:Protein HLJ1, partial [Linum perenne]
PFHFNFCPKFQYSKLGQPIFRNFPIRRPSLTKKEMDDNSNGTANRAEAERLLGVAEKLLQSRDLNGTKDFAVLAQETDPLLDGSDQILAVADVLLSSDKKINNHHHDWYSILQLDPRTNDLDLIKKQYRRLALLLHPDKNKFPFADQAFKLVADAWAVLSDSSKKSPFDSELSLFTKVDLSNSDKLPVRRSQRPSGSSRNNNNNNINSAVNREEQSQRSARMASFWTICPYCYLMYEYPRVYENCCLRCQKCERAFHAALIQSLPPMVPGKDAYYCSWGFFPLGFMFGGDASGNKTASASAFVNWMPPIFGTGQQQQDSDKNGFPAAAVAPPFSMSTPPGIPVQVPQSTVWKTPTAAAGTSSLNVQGSSTGGTGKKRGRPRKNPIQGQT